MSITVNTNMSSLICQRSLTKATSGMNTALQRMSTGLKINSAKDDAAGCAISSKMDYKLSSYSVAQDNAQMGQSMLDTASGSLSVMNGMLQRMRDLSEQAANGTYGKEERQAMQAEVDALTKELYRIKNTTDFNGKKVLGEETPSDYVKPDISINDIDVNNITQAEWDEKYKGAVIGISSADDLRKLATLQNTVRETTADGDIGLVLSETTFCLTKDIDLGSSENNMTAIGYGEPSNKTGVSFSFQGVFDGNGHTIKNLNIKKEENYQGLFGTATNATIKNVNLDSAKVVSNGNCAASLIGWVYHDSTIENCSATGTITNDSTKSYHAAGLISVAEDNVNINNCSFTGNITGKNAVGGFIGGIYGTANITNCSSNATVNGSNSLCGGFAGHLGKGAIVDNCFASGSVSGNNNVGGFAGDIRDTSTVSNSTTTCSISPINTQSGGFSKVIENDVNLSNNYYNNAETKATASSRVILDTEIQKSSNPPIPTPPTPVVPLEPQNPSQKTNLQVGINADENSVITVDTAFSMSGYNIDLSSEESARHSISRLDKLMATVSARQLDIGATSNRLASTMEFQEVQMSALTSANSLIKDADIAKESASYIKNQILQQTTATLLATANQNPSIALSLV